MKFSLCFRGAFAALLLVMVCACTPAHADTYTIYNLGNANANTVFGITDSGQVVTFGPDFCGAQNIDCYHTYTDGVATAVSLTAPDLAYDNGGACGSLPSGFSITASICNNGFIGFSTGTDPNPNGRMNGTFAGPVSDPTYLTTELAFDDPKLNAEGDLAWVDGRNEFIFEAVDTSTASPVPEPSGLLLLGTGAASFAALLRRRSIRIQ